MAGDTSGSTTPHGFTGRRTERLAVNAEVALRRSGQLNYRVRVFDASPLGCRLEFVERPQLEERVWVKFDRLDPIEGIVCWVDGFHAGIEYARPMHRAVFESLLPRLT
ncbi:MAG TPA: PilZ domain-containing protein [Sphingomicrobium sp.]